MKRTLITGILSANIVAAALITKGAAYVYSQNVGDFFFSETNMTSEAMMIYEVGPFAMGETHYSTDASGHMLNGPHTTNALIRSSTYFMLGDAATSIPLSPKSTAMVAAGILLALGTILSGALLRKSFKK